MTTIALDAPRNYDVLSCFSVGSLQRRLCTVAPSQYRNTHGQIYRKARLHRSHASAQHALRTTGTSPRNSSRSSIQPPDASSWMWTGGVRSYLATDQPAIVWQPL